MSMFTYTIRARSSRQQRGTLRAADAKAAAAALREQGAVILHLTRAAGSAKAQATPAGQALGRAPMAGAWLSRLTAPKPGSSAMEVGLKQLAVMVRSGLTLLESLSAVRQQATSRALARVLAAVSQDIRQGRSFTQAMVARQCFPRIVTQLVEIGEQTGRLDMVLERSAEILESRRLLKAQVVAALMYPAIVFLAALAVTVFILVYAIPKLSVYLRALGRPLPPMTQRLVDLSDLLTTQWPWLTGMTLLGMALFVVAYNLSPGRLLLDTAALRLPLIGYILRTSATAALSRSMAILLASGVTVVESLRTCQGMFRNRKLALVIAASRDEVMAGKPLSPGYIAGGAFMPMMASMIAAGERSGQLDQTLLECATFHEQRLSSLIRMLSSVIEVVVVVFVGGIVGYVYVAFMMALYGAAL